jgi:hypothetical protein
MTQYNRDLFGPYVQGSLGFEPPAPRSYLPKPEDVRAKLLARLALARASETWSENDISYWRLVFPQMSNWLPKDEAAQLCLEFCAELDRLEARA